MNILVAIVLLAPLLAFAANACMWRGTCAVRAGVVASLGIGLSFATSLVLWGQLLNLERPRITAHFFDWIQVGGLDLGASFLIDPLSVLMMLVITGVGLMIHIFSIGYMGHDKRPAKYFAYLSLFVFNMLVLVMADNLALLFVGWEGVGLCSYLLIGFWFDDAQKAAAGMKAFIVNRIGDAGFLLGLFLLFQVFQSLRFEDIAWTLDNTQSMTSLGLISLACFCLFIGATGKSAQIPLYVWLPDAMAGPTPVSALIHAATMVTAGVYMIARLSDVFMLAPMVMQGIAWVGALTALGAASMGLTQWDIKKILAYSTVSQLGYMFLALGVGAAGGAVFHLMTHAFFKALMFLGAGSVIHALHHEQDIRHMGGLKKQMPLTYLTFLAGWLAIIGVPGFSGFFSKDEILWHTYASSQGSTWLWLVGLVTALMTAFYMTRLMCWVFWGEARYKGKVQESPLCMALPLVVLAVLAVLGGFLGVPHVLGEYLGHMPHILEHWFEPVLAHSKLAVTSHTTELVLMSVSVTLVLITVWITRSTYLKTGSYKAWAQAWPRLHAASLNKYWVDEMYARQIIRPLVQLSQALWFYVDVYCIDGTVNGVARVAKSISSGVRDLQNGDTQSYALYMVLGLVFFVTCVLVL